MKHLANLSIVATAIASLIAIFVYFSGATTFPDFLHHHAPAAAEHDSGAAAGGHLAFESTSPSSTVLQPSPAEIARPLENGSQWNHNGSVMTLEIDGSSRRIKYVQPRPGMLTAGATPGSAVFEGTDVGGQWSGSAYVFNGKCGRKYPYLVEGGPKDGNAIIELKGLAPHVAADCSVDRVGTSNDDLIFSLQQ